MPYYDYKCTRCGHEFEAFKTIDERDEDEDCPICKATAKRMLLAAPGIVFHGSGFYVTDHRNAAGSAAKA